MATITLRSQPKTITETLTRGGLQGMKAEATVSSKVTLRLLDDGRPYVQGTTFRDGVVVEAFGCGGDMAYTHFERLMGYPLDEDVLAPLRGPAVEQPSLF